MCLTILTGVSYLRERKASIAKLFDAVGLQPRAGASFKTKRFNRKYEDAIDSLAKCKNGKTKKELVGDGEEIEVDASEELSGNDLNLIYQKCGRPDVLVLTAHILAELNIMITQYP